ncbi:hypothetical protein D3C85_89850 [compost metagenome]
MRREGRHLEPPLGRQRLEHDVALVVEAPRVRAAARADAARHLQRRDGVGVGCDLLGQQLEGRDLDRHRRRAGLVRIGQAAVVDRQRAQRQRPGLGVGAVGARRAGVGRLGRRHLGAAGRGLEPALEHPALLVVALDAHLGVGRGERRDVQGVLGHVDLGVDQLEAADAGQRGLGLGQRQAVGGQAARLELQVGLGPGHVDLAAELAVERGLQALRQVRRGQRQRQRLDLGLHVGDLVGGVALELQRGARDGGAAVELRGLFHGPGDGREVDAEVGEVDGCSGLDGFVAPADTAAVERDLVDLHLELGLLDGRLAARGAGGGRGQRRRLFGRAGRRVGGHQVELAGGVARHHQLRLGQRDLAQVEHRLQRSHVGQRQLERVEAQQVATARVAQLGAMGLDRAGDLQADGVGLLEIDLQVGIEAAGLQLHRQAAGDVAQVRHEVEPLELHVGVGLAALRERGREGGRVELAAVEREGQLGLGLDLALGGEVAQERHVQHEAAQLVPALDGLVVEVDRAVLDRDVVDREARGLGLRIGRRARGQLGQDVVDVVLAIGQVREQHGGRLDRHRVDHGRQAEQRLQFGVGIDALDGHLRLLAVGGGDAQVIQCELERPGLEVDLADGDLPAQLFARDLLELALGDRRHRQPRDDPQGQQHQQRDNPTPHPFVLFDRSSIHPQKCAANRCQQSLPKRECVPFWRGVVMRRQSPPAWIGRKCAPRKQESPVSRRSVLSPGLMAGSKPMPSIRATGSNGSRRAGSKRLPPWSPPSFESLTCTSDCLTSEKRLKPQARPD